MCKWPKKPRQTEEYSRRYGDFFSRGRSEISEPLLHYFYDVFHLNNKARWVRADWAGWSSDIKRCRMGSFKPSLLSLGLWLVSSGHLTLTTWTSLTAVHFVVHYSLLRPHGLLVQFDCLVYLATPRWDVAVLCSLHWWADILRTSAQWTVRAPKKCRRPSWHRHACWWTGCDPLCGGFPMVSVTRWWTVVLLMEDG